MSCQRCNSTLEETKTAQWDKFEADELVANTADHRDLIALWAKDEVGQFRRNPAIPGIDELRRRFPMQPQNARPRRPA